jgi:hypothetical protein
MLAIHRSTNQGGFYRPATASMFKPAGVVTATNAFLIGSPGCCDADLPDVETRS